ncbi:hypothetical protein ACWD6R_00025 [Streptomyces sp. NPDC005151]
MRMLPAAPMLPGAPFLLGSSRTDGNTEELARLAAEQLPPGTEQRWLNLNELTLPDFEDLRHEGDGGYRAPTGNAATLLDATLVARRDRSLRRRELDEVIIR